MKKYMLMIALAISILLIGSEIWDIPVTRNLMPEEHPEQSYAEYIREVDQVEFSYQEETVSLRGRRGCWLAVVESGLYNTLSEEIGVWFNDLEREGKSIIIVSFTGSDHQDLKAVINEYYLQNSIDGVFLLGNLPAFWYELWEDWDGDGIQSSSEEWVEFPMDAYYGDIDGMWGDLDNDGIYDQHEGDVELEIAVGRLRADNLSMAGEEEEVLHAWFERNNLYRNGLLADTDQGLGYIDDDWSNWAGEYESALELSYPALEMVFEVNSTTAYDYRENRWIADYEWIQVHVHSGPDAHYFYQNNGYNYNLVYNSEISSYNPTACFYNLFCCSNARFTQDNAMGSLYVLGNDHGLGSIGSTKTGSMLSFENFYAPLASGEELGKALQSWWNTTMVSYEGTEYEQCYRSWFYGMVMMGDPTMVTEYETVAELGDIDYNGVIEAYDASLVLIWMMELDPGFAAPLPWGAARKYLADVDSNNQVEAYDAALILQYSVGIIEEFAN